MALPLIDSARSIFQWDPSSRLPPPDPGSAPQNCAPTCVTFLANFFRNANFPINATRLLAAPNHAATDIKQQHTMLTRRGVPAFISQPSVTAMRALVASGRRPILIGLDMSKVSLATTGHPFRGMHAVVLRRTRVQGGVRGFDVLDPNFSKRTGRTDPTDGHRFYSEAQINAAFRERNGARSWALIPTFAKPLPRPAPAPLPDTSTTSEARLEMSVLAAIVRNTPQPAMVIDGASLYRYPGRNQPYWDEEVEGSLEVEVIGGVQSLDGSGFWRVLRRPVKNYRGVFFAHPDDVKFR